ncbi:MAG: hypothetical protein GY940_29760 [bacterium]|nr:hypothetical protein [bacterium]
MNEIEDFAAELKELDVEYRSGLLSSWAEGLLSDLETFDITKVQKTLSDFPKLLDQLAEMIER